MENGRKLLRGIALAAIAVIGLGGIALFASPSLAAQTRPDVIRIDAIGQLKKLEMPPAVFLHDEHTKALAATGQDCSVCHTPTANGHTVKFQRKEDGTDAKKLENIYHNGCWKPCSHGSRCNHYDRCFPASWRRCRLPCAGI